MRNGYTTEWPKTQSRTVPTGINTLFIVWAIVSSQTLWAYQYSRVNISKQLIPLLYAGGLAFLPRQYKQERYARVERVTELTKRPGSSA